MWNALPALALIAALAAGCGGGSGTPTSPTMPPGPTTPIATAESVTPSSGAGSTQTFAFRYTHNQGADALRTVHAHFGRSAGSSALDTCLIYYDRPANTLFLATDGLSDYRSAALGTATTLQNNQCSIDVGASSALLAGTALTLNLAMTFKPAFAGERHVHMSAGVDGTGWHERGTWTVPAS